MKGIRQPGATFYAALLLCLCTALSAGCGAEREETIYFPLRPGFQWQYRVTRTTMDGTQSLRHAVHTLPIGTHSGLAGARETLGGQRLEYRTDARGLVRVPTPGEPARRAPVERLVLPAVLAPGERWTTTDHTAVLENTGPPWETLFRIEVPVELRYEVESIDAVVSTPAGDFDNCLLVRAEGSVSADVGNYIGLTTIDVRAREWYAPQVGLVRLERFESTGAKALSAGSVVMELDDWRRP